MNTDPTTDSLNDPDVPVFMADDALRCPDASGFQEWKQSGDALLAQREAERKSTTPKTAETEIPVSEPATIQP